MAVMKRALVERASHAAVLFADDAHCMAMLDFIKSDIICLVSLQSGVEQIAKFVGRESASFCVLETLENEEWIILYCNGQRMPVMTVSDIPATFKGTAAFNVSNAMHAIAASYLAGINIEDIGDAMRNFRSGPESTPGRLNIFDELPFRVIIDFAHNADGFLKLSEFIDTQAVSGRKILVFGISDNTKDADIKAAMTGLAGHFDHYACVDTLDLKDRQAGEIPALLAAGLCSAGVAETDVSFVLETDEWWRHGLDMAAPGDLLVLIPDPHEVQPIWGLLGELATAKNDSGCSIE